MRKLSPLLLLKGWVNNKAKVKIMEGKRKQVQKWKEGEGFEKTAKRFAQLHEENLKNLAKLHVVSFADLCISSRKKFT